MRRALCLYLEPRKESAQARWIARAQRRPQRHGFATAQYDHGPRDGKLKTINGLRSVLAEATYRASPGLNALARARGNVCPARFLQATASSGEANRSTVRHLQT